MWQFHDLAWIQFITEIRLKSVDTWFDTAWHISKWWLLQTLNVVITIPYVIKKIDKMSSVIPCLHTGISASYKPRISYLQGIFWAITKNKGLNLFWAPPLATQTSKWFFQCLDSALKSGYHSCTTSFSKAWTQVLCRLKPCLWRVRDLQWSEPLTIIMAGNKAKWLSLVNHTTKTTNHHEIFCKEYFLEQLRSQDKCCLDVTNSPKVRILILSIRVLTRMLGWKPQKFNKLFW